MSIGPEHRRAPRNETVVSVAITSLIPATFAMSRVIRARVRQGALPALDGPRAERGLARFLPHGLLLRAVATAALTLMLLTPARLAVVAILHILPLTKVGCLIFNLVLGANMGVIMTRFVVLAALADPVRR